MAKRIPESLLLAILRRAAELQNVADQSIADGEDVAVEFEDQAGGYSVEAARAAAREAGIASESFTLTLAAMTSQRGGAVSDERLRRAVSFLGSSRWSYQVAVRAPVPAQRLLDALNAVAFTPRFSLTADRMVGNDPLEDGVLVFRTAGWDQWSWTYHAKFVNWVCFAGVRRILVLVRPAPGNRDRSRAVIYAPLNRALRVNHVLGAVICGLVGVFAGAGVWFVTSAVPPLGAAFAVVGTFAGYRLALPGWRAVYRWKTRRAEDALRLLADTVITTCRSASGRSSA